MISLSYWTYFENCVTLQRRRLGTVVQFQKKKLFVTLVVRTSNKNYRVPDMNIWHQQF